jgi:light-regulated signal transduction histidine kinase (bacteriophytochrome)
VDRAADPETVEVARIRARLNRERRVRSEAEHIAETATRDLYAASQELQRFNAELEQRAADLNKDLETRVRELEVLNAELETFTYSVSHDLRAPLRAIDAFSRLLLEQHAGRLDDEARGYIERICEATQTIADRMDHLLQLSRVARAEMRRQPVDLSAMARAIAADLQQRSPERQVEIVIADGMAVSGDPQLLRMALENLFDNAWKFTSRRQEARIDFGAVQEEGKPVYFVRDNGAGFDMAYADKLFQPFERLHDVAEFPGNGIGLATVLRVVNRHGGSIRAEGHVDKGATFWFTLEPEERNAHAE